MTAAINYLGKKGLLFVSHQVVHGTRKNHETLWRCTCDCGNATTLTSRQLKAGRQDCGCINPITVVSPHKKNGIRSSTIELKLHPVIDEFLYRFRANPLANTNTQIDQI